MVATSRRKQYKGRAMAWSDADATWEAEERPWDAPSPIFPHAVVAKLPPGDGGDAGAEGGGWGAKGEVIAWVRDPVDAALIARSHNTWAEIRPIGLRVVADSDQLRATLATQQ